MNLGLVLNYLKSETIKVYYFNDAMMYEDHLIHCAQYNQGEKTYSELFTHTGVVFIYKCTAIYIYITECWNQDQLQELCIILMLEKFFYQPVSFRQGFSATLLNNCLPPNLYLLIAFVSNSYNSVVKLDYSIWIKFNSNSSNTNAIYMVFYILVCRLGFLMHSQTMSINIWNWVYQSQSHSTQGVISYVTLFLFRALYDSMMR